MSEPQARFQQIVEEFQGIQKELQEIILLREQLEVQKQENESVQTEFGHLKDEEKVYKLVGPVLMEQEKNDAIHTVESRLEFIGKEIERVEKQIKDIQSKLAKKKSEIIELQRSMGANPGAAALAAAPAAKPTPAIGSYVNG